MTEPLLKDQHNNEENQVKVIFSSTQTLKDETGLISQITHFDVDQLSRHEKRDLVCSWNKESVYS